MCSLFKALAIPISFAWNVLTLAFHNWPHLIQASDFWFLVVFCGILTTFDVIQLFSNFMITQAYPWMLGSMSDSKFSFFYKDSNQIALGANPTLQWPHLNSLHLQWTFLQIRSYSERPQSKILAYEFEEDVNIRGKQAEFFLKKSVGSVI